MQRKFTSYKSADGFNIVYSFHKVDSNKPTIVFLHGIGGDHTIWQSISYKFVNMGFSTLAIDLRGHGKSSRPENFREMFLDGYTSDLSGVLNQENIKEFILVGFSLGGIIIYNFEKNFPRKSIANVLIAAEAQTNPILHKARKYFYYVFFPYFFFLRVWGWIYNHTLGAKYPNYEEYIGTDEFNVERLRSDVRYTGLDAYHYGYISVSDYDFKKMLRKSKAKYLFVVGENDDVANAERIRRHSTIARKSKFVQIPNTNHMVVLNNSDELYEILREYVLEVSE